MADKKISALSAAATPLAGTEVLPIVQSGDTVKVSVDNLTAGKAVSAAQLTVENNSSNPAVRITQTGAQLTNTADANRFIISVARAQLKRDIAQRNFYDKWWKDNGTYDGAEDAWATGEGNKSLFESPELKRFAAPARQPAAAPAGAGAYSDPDKERRYQEWKAKQGAK